MKAILIRDHEVEVCKMCSREVSDDFMYESGLGLICEDCHDDL